MNKLKLTSVKIKDDLHRKFKIECINDNKEGKH